MRENTGPSTSRPLSSLMHRLRSGVIDRRTFLQAAAALGVPAGMATFCANAAAAGGGRNGFAFYQGANGTPAASPAADAPGPPAVGMEGTTRGEGGELRALVWQAPTMAAPHSATGTKDFLAASPVLEPLMHFLPDGTIIPNLVEAVPSVENGLLAEDLSTATFRLLPGITWSDGEPFTAEDVVFTWQWITNPDNAAVTYAIWQPIEQIVAEDELTAVVTFKAPAATWFAPFVGGFNGPIYPAHVFGNDPSNPNDDFLTNPIGTGPFVIESFSPNDEIRYVANENYRDPNKPYFASIFPKGGGDAASAARAVLETGEFDYAWNLQIEPDILEAMTESSGAGRLVANPSTSVERIHINFSDPHTEVDGQRSEMNTPHPFLTDKAVRQAMNLAVPRDVIAEEFYGPGQPPTANILTGLSSFDSPNTSWEFNLEEANRILDEAGWEWNGDVRVKDGVELHVTYSTSVNAVRQKTQAVVKDAFNEIGIGVQLLQVDAGIFFDSSPGNEQNSAHMYWDIDMWTNSPDSPIPTTFMTSWYAGPNRENIAQRSNQWQGQNYQRWVSEEFDALYESLIVQTDPEAAADILIQMNDLLIEEVVVIPQVNRGSVFAIANSINEENIAAGPGFELTFWNIANWNRLPG